jgi:2-oxoglutarate ferredoxin oxidoreductase subunit alpha
MIKAFDAAQRYQMPVILLSDFYLANRKESVHQRFKKPGRTDSRIKPKAAAKRAYDRYRLTPNGISPMSIPGEKDTYFSATGLEHDEKGIPTYTPENHIAQSEKRYRKWRTAGEEMKCVEVLGDEKADIGIISWGSTTGAAIEAAELAGKEGICVKVFKTLVLWPLPGDEIMAFAKSVRKVIIPEMNVQGQFARLLQIIDMEHVYSVPFATGEPVTPCEILAAIKKVSDVLRKK